MTISLGIAAGDSRNVPSDVVVQVADRALYQAKRGGRNRIAV
ncbi:MAG: diguanylate cyclase domain-containing protein [Planctomycetaceae bacterium]